MNKFVWAIAILVLIVPVCSWSQQNDSSAGQSQAQSSASSGSSASSAPALQQDSLAEAARKSREQKKNAATQAKVFTNDNMPTSGGISTVGGESTPSDNAAAPAAETGAKPGSDEKKWRDRFAELHHRLDHDQTAVDVAQRELGELNVQFYGDPMKGMQQGLTRSDINDKIAEIDRLKAQVVADQKAIDDAEEELRKSGGDPGWAR